MKHRFTSIFRFILIVIVLAASVSQPQSAAYAATSLTVTPITWNVIGLDSNNVNVGPNDFPIGARVCNGGGSATSVTNINFVWDDGLGVYTSSSSADTYINLRNGTLDKLYSAASPLSLAAGACYDAYFEVIVNRVSTAYNHVRNYHITATDSGGTASTPRPRQLLVEHLISQSRNSVTNMKLSTDGGASYTSITAGGTMTLMVGSTYKIQLWGSTATNGYEQIEDFINFPNTIFQVLSVNTTYTADTSSRVNGAGDNKLYGDGCLWENTISSPNYRSCLDVGKAGGDIVVTYEVKILTVPNSPLINPEPLSTLIYDFSGSSYHYNADFGVQSRYAYVLDPATITFSKSFTADSIIPAGTSTLTIKIPNTTTSSISGVNFTDTLPTSPGAMTVAGTPSASTTGCGSPTFAPAATNTSLSFSHGTIAAGTTCIIKVNVTAPTVGTYTNTTGHLFINGTTPGTGTDTGNTATANLTIATNAVSQTCGRTLAGWTVPAGTTANPPDATGGVPNTGAKADNVATATVAAGVVGTSIVTKDGYSGATDYSWETYGFKNNGQYLQYAVNTKNYSGVTLSFAIKDTSRSNGPTSLPIQYSTSSTGPWTTLTTITFPPADVNWHMYPATGAYDFTGLTSTTGITYFRITPTGANTDGNGGALYWDQMTFSGCSYDPPPTLTKSFGTNPIATNSGVSLLTFNIANPGNTSYDSTALTGVNFSDTLPTGLLIVNDASHLPATTCTSGSVTAANNTTAISMTGASLTAGGTCTMTVYVKGTTAGVYDNVSGYIGSTQSGQNKTSSGYGTAQITVVDPPVIAKSFGTNTILSGATTTYTFTLTNPNINTTLTGVNFTDTYPGTLTNTGPLNITNNTCGGTDTATGGGSSFAVSNVTLLAGASCTVTVDVTATTASTSPISITDSTGQVAATGPIALTGNTPTATLYVKATAPAIALLKQVGPSSSGPWTSFLKVIGTLPQNVYFNFKIENTGDTTLTNVRINDLSIPGLDVSSCVTASLAQYAYVDCVAGPISVSSSGSYSNTANATSDTATSANSTAQYATANLLLTKSVAEPSFTAAGNVLHYTYSVYNNSTSLVGPVTLADDKSGDESCIAVTTVGNLDANLDPGEGVTCTATYTVLAADVTAGYVTNTATATAANSGSPVNSNTASKTVLMSGLPDLRVTKGNNVSGSVYLGNSFNWTLLVTNPGLATGTFSSGQTILRDPLPAGATYGSPTAGNLTNITGTGGISCSIDGSNVLTCVANGGTVIIGATSGSFTATFSVKPTATGSLSNTATVDSSTLVPESNESNNTSADTVTVTGAAISGTVYKDLNGNGSADSGETGINGVTVTLLTDADSNGSYETTVTSTSTSSGAYSFTNLPLGAYRVVETNPSGYISTGDTQGANNDQIDVTLTAGATTSSGNNFLDSTRNFGHLPASYTGMNMLADGGASNINGTTYLGTRRPDLGADPTETDGANGGYEDTDDGVTWTPGVTWSVATGGSVNVIVTCPVATCYLNAWFDWTKDGIDFSDTGEQIFNNQAVVNGSNTLTFSIPAGTVLNGDTFHSRFRVSPQTMTSPLPNGPAVNGTTLLMGEIEDPIFQIVSGNEPTPITVSYFNAQRQGKTVNFNWSTATETGNVGFNLYVESGNQLTLINKTLIPSRVIDSLDRQDYTFRADVAGNIFYIEDVSISNETRKHGPFTIGKTFGDRLEADKINQAAIQKEHNDKQALRQDKLKQEMSISAAELKQVAKLDKSIKPTATPIPTKTEKPTKPGKPTATPTGTSAPTATLDPTATPIPTGTSAPTATLEPTATPIQTGTSAPTATLDPTAVPTYTATLDPTAVPTYTATLEPTATTTSTATLEPTATPVPIATGVVDPNTLQLTTTLNLKVRKTGIYRVTYEMLQSAGLDLIGTSTANIALINRGQIAPIYMITQTGSFGPGDYFEFYGEALDTIYTDTNIYTVQVSSIPVWQMQKDNTAPNLDLVAPISYTETLTVNNQRAFANYAPNTDAWYNTSMLAYKTSKNWSFPFQINGLVTSSTPQSLELVVWGVTDFPETIDHHLKVSVNGVLLADETFNGLIEKTIKITLPAGTLHEGANTLQLTLPGDTGVDWDMVNLDKFSITYQRAFQTTNGSLTFTAAGDVFNLSNLPGANVAVYRINAAGLTRLENVNVQASGTTYTAAFAGSSQPATYLVSTAALTPILEVTRLKADLNRPAQYLIISHPNFIADLQPLVQARQAQGLTVSVVDVNDLYAQYNDGIFDPQAIKKYIAYAAQNLGTQYILLVGGDTYDYRNFMGKNSISFIPSLYVTTGDIAKFVPADPLYADLNADNVPDLAIGRFPVRTQAELSLMINKTLAYAAKNYGRTAVFASDQNDGIVSFKDISNSIAASLPANWSTQSIHLDDTSIATAQQQLLAAMNRGTALITFTGHSGPAAWTFSNLFTTKNAAALTNTARPFVAVQWGCWNTYYVDPVNNYLVQSLLFSGDKGAAAVLGASTLTDSGSEELLGTLLTPRIITPGKPIGLALQEAKSELAHSHPELLDVLLGWSLMGDPALVVEP